MSAGLSISAVTQTVISRVLLVIVGLATSVITARVLGPEGRGAYFYVFTFATLAAQFATLGVHSSNAVLVARDPALIRALAANSVWIAIVAGGSISAIALGVVALADLAPLDWRLLTCTLLLVPALVVNLLLANLYAGIGRMSGYNMIIVASGVASFLSAVIGALLRTDAAGLILLLTFANLIASVALVIWTAAQFEVPLKFDPRLLWGSFGLSARAFVVNSLGFVVLRTNVLVLGFFAGPVQVGFYSIGAQVFDVATIVPVAFATVLFPALFQSDAPWLMLRRSVIRVSIFMAFALAVGAALTPALLPLIFGAAFTPAVPVTLALLPGAWAVGVTSIISQFLSAHGFPPSQILIWSVALVVMCVLVPIASTKFGALGAAIVLSGVSLLVMFSMLLAAQRLMSTPLRAARGN